MPGYAKPPSYNGDNITITPTGSISATTLQAGIAELDSEKTTESYVDTTVNTAKSEIQSNKNLLYNGAMRIAQRGTSSTSITTTGYYTADRWKMLFANNVGAWTQTIENDAPSGSGFNKSLKVLCTTAKSVVTTDLLGITQQLEGQDIQHICKGTSSAKELTLSFWVKSNVTGTYIAYLYDDTNSRHIASPYTIQSSGSWERKEITFEPDTTGAFANSNSSALYVFFNLAAGADLQSGTLQTTWDSYNAANRAVGQVNLASSINNYWQITGVQLEVDTAATDFEFKSFGQELRECERYFEKSFPYSVAPNHNSGGLTMLPNMGSLGCGGNSYTQIQFRTQKRIGNGTLRWYDPVASHTSTENWARTISNCTSGTAYQTSGSFTAYESYITGYFQIGTGTTTIAEWTCDTEL